LTAIPHEPAFSLYHSPFACSGIALGGNQHVWEEF